MKFCFELGDTQKHRNDYQFHPVFVRLVVLFGYHEVLRRLRPFNEPVQETCFVRVKPGNALNQPPSKLIPRPQFMT
jgi:hypothetical protein